MKPYSKSRMKKGGFVSLLPGLGFKGEYEEIFLLLSSSTDS